jgi:predicted MPP superfamily phosphohydrolase
MNAKKYKKEKKESFFQKIVNIFLTITMACAISSQVCTAANNNLRIAQVSDVHYSSFEDNTSYKMLKKSADLLNDVILQLNISGPYDFVVFTGDLINKPKKTELEKFAKYASKLNYDWYAVNGNHDIDYDKVLNKVEFIKILASYNKNMDVKNTYYAFTPKRGFRVICLDSIIDYRITSNGEISKEQLLWLKKELNISSSKDENEDSKYSIRLGALSGEKTLENDEKIYQVFNANNNFIIYEDGSIEAL